MRAEPTGDAGARADIWSIQSDFNCRHHSDLRVSTLCAEGKKHSLFREYIDVTRSTHTDLDVLQEKRIDVYWNVDSNRSLSGFLDRVHEVHSIEVKKPSTRIHVVRKENDKNSHDDQTQKMVRKYGREFGNAAQNREKQELVKEKLELDNARKNETNLLIDPGVRES